MKQNTENTVPETGILQPGVEDSQNTQPEAPQGGPGDAPRQGPEGNPQQAPEERPESQQGDGSQGGDATATEGGDAAATEGGDTAATEGGDTAATEGGDAGANEGETGATEGEAGADGTQTLTAEVPPVAPPPEPPKKPGIGLWWIPVALVVIAAAVVLVLRRLRGGGDRGSVATVPVGRHAARTDDVAFTAPQTEASYAPESAAATAPIAPTAPEGPSTRVPQRVVPAAANQEPGKTEALPEDEAGKSRYSVGVAQTIGSREDQEDSYAISNWRDGRAIQRLGLLAAVADGVGGLDDGQVASNTLMRSLCEEFSRVDPTLPPQDRLLELTARGQQEVLRIVRSGRRCGTTLVAMLAKDDYVSTMSVGDSRIALYRAGTLLQLNREHVLGKESDEHQALTNSGGQTNARKRGAITSYIGMEGLRSLDRTLNPIRLVSGDRVLLMSDGVFGTLGDDELIAFLNREPQAAAEGIIKAVEAKRKPHQDNATIVIVGLD